MEFLIPTGAVNGTTITRVRVRVRFPSGALADVFDDAPTSATATTVVARWIFADDGSSLPENGDADWVASLFTGAGPYTRAGDTVEGTFPIPRRKVPLPPTP